MFTNDVEIFRLSKRFKVANIPVYTGFEDPIEHLDNFRAHLDLHGTPNEEDFQDYNWTSLNAPNEEVLSTIKKDPMYEKH
jgi:hypothetical protein